MSWNFGISTVYFVSRLLKENKGWDDLRRELGSIGIKNLELSTEIPEEWLPEIKRSVACDEVKVLSLHNFCPKLKNIPKGKNSYNAYLLSSEDEEERSLSVEYTKKTIDLASDLGAEVVVLHAGSVKTEPPGYESYKILLTYGAQSHIFQKYRENLVATREKNKDKYRGIILKSLDEVVPYAEKKSVIIGLETRFFPDEIPNFEEIGILLKNYNSKYFRYWHDFGHAEIMSKLGFAVSHKSYFESYSEYLKGYHIHDLKGYEDHFVPGSGEIDFSAICRKEEYLYIMEVHSKESIASLKRSIKFLNNFLTKS